MPTKRARRGRPAEIKPERLLDAARTIFAERGYDGATTRELARQAHCNIAMISYHFGSKEGLYDAVLARHFKNLSSTFATELDGLATADAALAKQWPELSDADERRLCASLFAAGRLILLDEEMQRIVSRELMAGGKRIATLVSRNGGGFALPLRERLDELARRKRVQVGLDTGLGVISLLGPLIYSCITRPLIKIVYGFEHDEAYVRGLCLHLTRTFFRGWGA